MVKCMFIIYHGCTDYEIIETHCCSPNSPKSVYPRSSVVQNHGRSKGHRMSVLVVVNKNSTNHLVLLPGRHSPSGFFQKTTLVRAIPSL